MDTLVRHIWNIKDPKEYTKYESTVIRLLNELDKDCTRHDNRMKYRTVQKQFLKSLDKNKTILLYLKDDEVVGLTLMIVSEGLISTLSLSDLIVDSKYRNKGYGSYILEDSINYAKERKFKNVCLQVFTNNTVARNMYLKRGFKPITEFMILGLESMNTINKDTYILEIGNESLYLKSLSQYKYLVTYDFNEVGLESFGSEILRIITGILDTILKLLNNFKATVLGIFKDLKRTELQEYEDSNKITLQRVLKYPYEFLANQNVVVPRGIVKPYKVTTEKIKGCLDVLDMVNRSEKALASVDNVLNMLMSNTKLQVKQDTINVGELRSLEHIFKEENACFSPFKRCEELPFSKVFVSDHCLKDTYDLLSNTVTYEQDVSRVYNTLNAIYQKFEQILRLVESNQVNITKSDLIMLSGQTTTLAKLFDLYGTVITDLQRVEHNFVLVLSSIAEKHGL